MRALGAGPCDVPPPARTHLIPDVALSTIFFIVTNCAKLVYNVGARYAAKQFLFTFLTTYGAFANQLKPFFFTPRLPESTESGAERKQLWFTFSYIRLLQKKNRTRAAYCMGGFLGLQGE